MAQFLELKSANYESIEVVIAGAAVVKGDYATYNDINGFYISDGAIGDTVILITKAEKVKAVKQAALAINNGDAVYYDSAADEVDKTNTNDLVGFCIKSALAGDTHVMINFNGYAKFLKT